VDDESQLIDGSLQGNTADFGRLVQRHQDRLYNAIAHFVGDRTEAEDIVQEAFVQAYLKLHSFQRNSAFYTWLYRIAFNTAVSLRRKKRIVTSAALSQQPGAEHPQDKGETPDQRLIRAERAQQLQAALEELSEEHRAILVLRELEDCDYDTIAEILDINIGTVRSRLHRARLQLRLKLEQLRVES
jgi:RNA polymerase sigma-70 factor (ECF subfamily)